MVVSTANGAVGIRDAMAVLRDGGSALDAVEAGTRRVELNARDHTVGLGGLPNIAGEVRLDASIMDGRTLRAGAVGSVRGILHAITLARRVMERRPARAAGRGRGRALRARDGHGRARFAHGGGRVALAGGAGAPPPRRRSRRHRRPRPAAGTGRRRTRLHARLGSARSGRSRTARSTSWPWTAPATWPARSAPAAIRGGIRAGSATRRSSARAATRTTAGVPRPRPGPARSCCGP